MNRKERRANKVRAKSGENDALLQSMTDEGLAHYQAGRLAEAEQMYRQVLIIEPEYADALHLMGVLANDTGHYDIAAGLIGDAIEVRDDVYFYHNNLGNTFKNAERLDDAVKAYKRALTLKSDFAEPHNSLGVIAVQKGDLDTAENHYKRAVAIKPDFAEAWFNMGVLLRIRERYEDAIKFFEKAIALRPNYVEPYIDMAHCLRMLERFDDAVQNLEKALILSPNNTDAMNNMGNALMPQGKLEETLNYFRRSLVTKPDQARNYHDLLLVMIYMDSVTPEELAATARQFGERLADPLMRQRPFTNDKGPDRKLRIGYISPDFRWHSVAYFFEPLLSAHDRSQFEIFAYASVGKPDHFTERLRRQADHWRDVAMLDDETVANMIEADGIDILVDLAGHTGSTRLLVLARKPAPVQVSWLGYPGTTGMKAIDYRITDPYAEPEGMTEHLNVETLWRLPQIFSCFYNGDRVRPDVIGHPPLDDNGYITFGCFNNFVKVTDPVLKTWARILERLPQARLLLEIPGIQNSIYRAKIEARLKEFGLPVDRVILEPRTPQNQYVLYNRIDIALDPFPCVGGTTTSDTLWMGVPLVTLAGKHLASRMGVSLLSNIGLPELIAQSQDQYVEIAVALANDKEKLHAMRNHIRDTVETSPLMDKVSFAKNMEDAYRAMWKKWCAGEAQ